MNEINNEILYDYENEYLPIGSIVSVRFSPYKFMIIGFATKEAKGRIYDYSAVNYPEGLIDFDNVIMFNKDIIKKVYYLGLINDSHKEFNEKVKEAVNKLKLENKEEN